MALLTGMTEDGREVPVQVDASGRLVAEGLQGMTGATGPAGPAGNVGPAGPVGPTGPAWNPPTWNAGQATITGISGDVEQGWNLDTKRADIGGLTFAAVHIIKQSTMPAAEISISIKIAGVGSTPLAGYAMSEESIRNPTYFSGEVLHGKCRTLIEGESHYKLVIQGDGAHFSGRVFLVF